MKKLRENKPNFTKNEKLILKKAIFYRFINNIIYIVIFIIYI